MNAAVLHAVGDLRYEKVPMPLPKDGEVLMKIGACGICGSDIPRVFEKGTYHFPTVPGHEFAGTVVAGDDALVGKKAAVFPLLPCRKCTACEMGEYANCSNYDYYGSRRDGAFAEYLAVDKRNLVLLPEGLDCETASLCEPAAVARAAVRKLGITLGDLVVIWGAGPIGLMAAQWAKAAGARDVKVVDISEEKLAFAKKFGFEAYDKERDGLCDCALEGTGAGPALSYLVTCVKSHGHVVLMGNPARDMTIKQSDYSQILRREIILRGTWNSSFNTSVNDWQAAVNAMADGTLKCRELITHRFALSDCNKALEMMRDKKEFFTKVTFVMD
ncbi:MAG: galactitol-1-phosphate 5-dehydrogenase [Clostridia bacterium]|nr:galactitol-1-phosphate 5-dehydrogenase [Clostridia bacterium]